ncbi:MAG TPA: DsbA family oxidoreductase [Acidimicrobiales bacterium]|nr:DsbA family oxidoreductase [Acidimicrobiales bacterium]
MRIDVWSDVICPWCYLGARRLDRALDQVGWRDEVEVHWRAFQLDPSASREPGDLRRALERKYGPGAFDSMARRLTALGAPEGIDYRFDLALRVNTLDAHRLLAWADGLGAAEQGALSDRLFRAYFTEGANVADHEALVRLVGEAGLDADEAADVLASGAFAGEVQADLDAARDRDIHGVPNFVIEDRLSIPGAQEVDTMVMLLQRARERLTAGA